MVNMSEANMTEILAGQANLVEQVLHEFGRVRARYGADQQRLWDQMGLTLGDRDRAIEQLVAQGRVTIRLRPGGVEVRLAEPGEELDLE